MLKENKNKIFIFFILISIITSIYFVIGRANAEKNYKNYEVCAGYDDFSRMAYSENKSTKEYFKELMENGVTTVTFNEKTINSMEKDPNRKLKTTMSGMDLIVEGEKEDLDFIADGLKVLKDERNIEFIEDNQLKIEGKPYDMVYFKPDAKNIFGAALAESGEKDSILKYIGLGFDGKEIKEISEIENIAINLRPIYFSNYEDPEIAMNRYFEALDKYSRNQNYIVFAGKEAYKNTEKDSKIEEDFKKNLIERDLAVGMIEASTQRGNLGLDGINPIVNDNNIGKLRVFTTWDYIQSEYDYCIPGHHNGEELTNVYYRAISERNIAAIFLRPFIKNDNMISDAKVYGNVLGDLEMRLAKKGYETGNAHAIGEWNVNTKVKFFIACGTTLASVMMLGMVFGISERLKNILYIVGILLAGFFFILGKKEATGSILFNLAAIVSYPTLSLVYIANSLNRARKSNEEKFLMRIYIQGLKVLVIAIIISLIGALMEISYMSGTKYLVELSIFRGVKVSQLLPILLSVFVFASYVGIGRKEIEEPHIKPREIAVFMNEPVKFWQAALGCIILVILAVFILRGGNTSAKVPGMELWFRNMLERYLPARPRTKSLFIGYPAIILLIYFGYKKRGEIVYILLLIFASIGMADIVNTFSHIRTPMNMSIARVLIEYVGAAVLGLVLIIIVDLIMKGYDKIVAKK